uniref:Putative salivary kunitz domain protein n=1 Tax=Ixodes ricinus TaxID=34613 RepID=A0A0K8RE54_IXORI
MVTCSSIRPLELDEFMSMKGNLARKFGFKGNSRGEVYKGSPLHHLAKSRFRTVEAISLLQYHPRAKHPCTPLQQGPSAKTQTTIDAFS